MSPQPADVTDTVYFTNTTIGATWYEWDFGDGSTSNLVNPKHKYSAPGFYTVTFIAHIDSLDCDASIQDIAIINSASSISEEKQQTFNVYPVPATNTIEFSSTLRNGIASILSLDGKLLQSMNFSSANAEIDISTLKPGTYLLLLNSNETSLATIIVKL